MTPGDRDALRAYWSFFAPHRAEVVAAFRAAPPMPEAAMMLDLADFQREHDLANRAILDDDWPPYLTVLRERGAAYARAGVPIAAWFALKNRMRDHCFALLTRSGPRDAAEVSQIYRGAHLHLDASLEAVGSAFFQAKADETREQEQRFRAMFDDNPVAMWMYDVEAQRLLGVNATAVRTYGSGGDELSSMTHAALGAVGRAPAQPGEGGAGPTLWRHQRRDGSNVLVEVSCHAFRHGERSLQLIAAVDVTEREQAREALRRSEAQLQQSQKMDALGRLASGVAHDFNNILMIVQSAAYMLHETFEPGDARLVETEEIQLASERAIKLTRQLLALSRQSVVTPRPVAIDELVAALVPSLRRLLGPGVAIEIHRGGVPLVTIDPGQLEQVVMNLSVNARDAMNENGRVTIETSVADLDAEQAALHGLPAGRYVLLAVTDTGPGIPPELRARIFDPFFTTKEAGKGTGLGLSIVHGIVTQARGTIELYSELGHGTSFQIRLPVSGEAATRAAQGSVAEAPERSPTRALQPVTILFVDHERELRGVISRMLQAAGCTVLEAANAAEARQACVTYDGTIHVAVIDIALSDGRGDQLARELRELRSEMKVLLMSGFPTAALGPTGDAPMEILAKPFTPGQLRDAIASMVTAAPTRRSEPTLRSRVLVADDDPTLRRMLVRLLTRAAFEVVDVDSGRGALAALAGGRFDVILSDIHMPDGDGLELLRAVRRIDLDIPVILMSGKPDVASAATALEFGAFRYLTKPLETDVLERIVRQAARACALARLRREAVAVGAGRLGAIDRAGLEVRFEQAIDQMFMAFQPIVDARSRAIFGVEALMRSREPSLPHPGAVLEAASSLGRMSTLGRRTRGLSAEALRGRPDIPSLFVNLHPEDILDVQLIDEASPLTQMAPRVILEVTERESLPGSEVLNARLVRLRELGYRIAVDDIGAGYSGLTSFTDLMPEIVKIDMSLVRGIHASTVKQRTVGALCSLCHDMGTLVVAEGVETAGELDCVISLGCDLLQGYVLARPSPELPAVGREYR